MKYRWSWALRDSFYVLGWIFLALVPTAMMTDPFKIRVLGVIGPVGGLGLSGVSRVHGRRMIRHGLRTAWFLWALLWFFSVMPDPDYDVFRLGIIL